MLNYRTTISVAIACLTIALVISFFRMVPIWLFAGIILVTLSLLVYGSVSIQSGFYIRALCSAEVPEKKIAISFDDGPDPENTPAILDVLLENNIQAIFFCIGDKIIENKDIIQRMHDEGHIIGNHSFSHHRLFDLFSMKHMKRELEQTSKEVFQITGKKIILFRPPYGVTNPVVARVARLLDYTVIGWSLKSKDTVIHDAEALMKRLKKKLKSGDIVLFHDTCSHTVNTLKDFIQYTLKSNYGIIRIDQLLNIDAHA